MHKKTFKILPLLALIFSLLNPLPVFAEKNLNTDSKIQTPSRRPFEDIKIIKEEETKKDIIVFNINEGLPLPAYPENAKKSVGKISFYTIEEEDTLLDIARHFRLGFIETRAANLNLDPWTPTLGAKALIPSFKLIPRTKDQEGIIVNLAQMRLYYFKPESNEILTFPIGIGREGLQTPTGHTTIVRKREKPMWYPTERMREEKPWLPAAIPSSPSNPLGTHALYLGWPTFLIHGSSKPWAIGRRVSSGCMRMYPEDIKKVFKEVPIDTKITVVDQPILLAWIKDKLYLEANPSKTQGNDIEIKGTFKEKPLDSSLKKVIEDAAGEKSNLINWESVEKIIKERKGYPIEIADAAKPPPQKKLSKKHVKRKSRTSFHYN